MLSTSFNSGVSIEVVRRRLGHASTETTQAYTLLADKVADTEIAPPAASARPRAGEPGMARGSLGSQRASYGKPSQCASARYPW